MEVDATHLKYAWNHDKMEITFKPLVPKFVKVSKIVKIWNILFLVPCSSPKISDKYCKPFTRYELFTKLNIRQ